MILYIIVKVKNSKKKYNKLSQKTCLLFLALLCGARDLLSCFCYREIKRKKRTRC
jgi:hypothetical protein